MKQAPPPTRLGELGQPSAWMSGRLLLLLALASLAFAASALAQAGPLRPGVLEVMLKWAPLILSGFAFNLVVSIVSMALGTAAGALLGLAQIARSRLIRGPSWLVVQFFRNAPWLVLLFYAILLLPYQVTVFGLTVPLPASVKAIIGLALPVMGNVAEIVRGGVRSIPYGQWESAESLAFSRWQTLTMIILPQALKRMIPPWMNLYAVLTMATTLISVVGVEDALARTRAALIAEGRSELLMPMYGLLLILFFAYCYPIARWTRALERRFAVKT